MPGEFKDKIVVISGGSRGHRPRHRAGLRARGRADRAGLVIGGKSRGCRQGDRGGGAGAASPSPATCASSTACEQLFAARQRTFPALRRAGQQCGRDARRGISSICPTTLWLDGYALKFFGCVRLTRLFWPLLKASRRAASSTSSAAPRAPPDPEFLIGGSVNAAMANFSKGLSKLGKRDGVNVNAIHPGNTDDRAARNSCASSGRRRWARRSRSCAPRRSPRATSRRFGKPEDIAALALFLCSERARHIQGTAIAVDGGATPGQY